MISEQATIWRGLVWRGEGDQAPWAGSRLSGAFEPKGFVTGTLAARPSVPAPVRWFAIKNSCQTSSSGDYFVLLGASFTGSEGRELKIEVAYGSGADQIDERLAGLISDAAAEAAAGVLTAGTLRFAHARLHPVDNKPWAWKLAAKTVAHAVRPELWLLPGDAAARRISAWWQNPKMIGQ